jgi:hypothetical protein
LALFAERVRPEPRPVAGAEAAALAELVAGRRQIVEMMAAEGQRGTLLLGFFADATINTAVMTTLPAGTSFGTLDLKVNFLRPVTPAGQAVT